MYNWVQCRLCPSCRYKTKIPGSILNTEEANCNIFLSILSLTLIADKRFTYNNLGLGRVSQLKSWWVIAK